MKGLPYMEAHAEPYMRNLAAEDVVSGPLITFAGAEKVANIMHALKITGHNGFPVVDEPPFSDAPELCWLVLRSHLLVLQKGKMFTEDRASTGPVEVYRRFGAFDFATARSGKGLKFQDLDIDEEEMEMYVDLHPITSRSPCSVVETMSVAKAAVLFRELGLGHLCGVPKTPGVRILSFLCLLLACVGLTLCLIPDDGVGDCILECARAIFLEEFTSVHHALLVFSTRIVNKYFRMISFLNF